MSVRWPTRTSEWAEKQRDAPLDIGDYWLHRPGIAMIRYAAMSFDTTLAEDTEEIGFATVQARVNEWQDRIDALYQQLKIWSPAGYTWDTSQHLTMHEELMKNYGVPPIELPVLNIFDKSGWKAKIIPYGLWIIGGDGRLDLLTGARRFLITGAAPSLGSGWRISELGTRWDTDALDESSWLAALQ